VRGKRFWEESIEEPIVPPEVRRMPGRPKKNRRKDKDEPQKGWTLSRRGRIMTCRLCKTQGHNAYMCPTKPASLEVIIMLLNSDCFYVIHTCLKYNS